MDFLKSAERMRFKSPKHVAEDPKMARVFHFVERAVDGSSLPWLEVNSVVIVAVSRIPDDDSGIVLDYRSDTADSRVVASDWDDNPLGCRWREVAPSFSEFVEYLAAERIV